MGLPMTTEDDSHTLRIFTLLFVNSFLIGAAVGIHQQGLWFPEEQNWAKIGGLYMMASTFIQMIAFMLYKLFFQERLEDQSYIQNLMTQSRRNMKKINAEMQRYQLGMEMEVKKRQMSKQMELMKQQHLGSVDDDISAQEKMMIELQ